MIVLLENQMLGMTIATFQVMGDKNEIDQKDFQACFCSNFRFDTKIDLAIWTNFSFTYWQLCYVWIHSEKNVGFAE